MKFKIMKYKKYSIVGIVQYSTLQLYGMQGLMFLSTVLTSTVLVMNPRFKWL